MHEWAHWRYNLGEEYPRETLNNVKEHFYSAFTNDENYVLEPNRCSKAVFGEHKMKGTIFIISWF